MMIFILIILLVIHLSYYVLLFGRLARHSDPKNFTPDREKLSLVVCFKNEVSRIDKLLPILMSQGLLDVILVDDFSDDDTLGRLRKYESEVVRVIKTTVDQPGKKQAIHDGISAAKYNRILVTDADCEPSSEYWAREMNRHQKPIVLGYSPMRKKSGLVNLFSRFETYMTGVQYLSYAEAGIPYMGVGRNMIIDRSLRAKHYDGIKGKDLAGGDDDLTINTISTAQNTTICIDPETFVYTDSVDTWSAFFRQKTRHISTAVHYKFHHQVLLSLFSASQILFYPILIIGLFSGTVSLWIWLFIYMDKLATQTIIHLQLMKKLKEEISIPQLLLLDLLLFLYYLVMPVLLLIRKKDNRWS